MDERRKQILISDDLIGASPGHEEVHYSRRSPTSTNQDLFALAANLGWSELENEKLKDVYGIALKFDNLPDEGQKTQPEAQSTSK